MGYFDGDTRVYIDILGPSYAISGSIVVASTLSNVGYTG